MGGGGENRTSTTNKTKTKTYRQRRRNNNKEEEETTKHIVVDSQVFLDHHSSSTDTSVGTTVEAVMTPGQRPPLTPTNNGTTNHLRPTVHHYLRSEGVRGQRLITEYLPRVKKSQRIANQKKINEEEELKKECISKGIDPTGFSIKYFGPRKGRGIIAEKAISKGDFVCEYSGELINLKLKPAEAKERDSKYAEKMLGSYMYYFEWKNVKYCLDATIEDGSLGRLINHSRKHPNCKTSVYEHEGIPHLIFVALKDIQPGQELLYDYGETDKKILKANPWLASS